MADILQKGNIEGCMVSQSSSQSKLCRPETGHVKLVLETDGQDDTSFQRTIVMGRGSDTYSSQYAVNDHTVSWATYEEKLKTFGILVKARNFLVFQACYPFLTLSLGELRRLNAGCYEDLACNASLVV